MEKKQNWYSNKKKFHFIYKTTNLVNGKYYIGMHSTDNLADGYIGSGKMLGHSVNKYGKDNHKTEILEQLIDRKSLKIREYELVTKELLLDPLCMNLTFGGDGGWEYHNSLSVNKEFRIKGAVNANRSEKKNSNLKYLKGISDRTKQMHIDGKLKAPTFTGKNHNEETKNKIGTANAIHQIGSGNSQFGTCWIFSEIKERSIKIQKEELEIYLKADWKVGRKMKF